MMCYIGSSCTLVTIRKRFNLLIRSKESGEYAHYSAVTQTLFETCNLLRNFNMQSSPDCSVLALLTLNIIKLFECKALFMWMHELQTVALRTAHKLTPPARPSITQRRDKHGLLICFLSNACNSSVQVVFLLLLLLSQSSARVVLLKLCQNLCYSLLHATSFISLHT